MTDTIHNRIDLHTHTTASDGLDRPAELVRNAVAKGISILGVTDHDTIDALKDLETETTEAGITLVPGVELSTTVHRAEVHILGYFVNMDDPTFVGALDELAQNRIDRIIQMIEKVRGLGYDIDGDAIIEQSKYGSIGRPHVARALMDIGVVKDVSEAFERFLKAGRPGYVPRQPFMPEEAVQLLVGNGAIPVLAHPYSTKDIEGTLKRLVPVGLRGLETYYASYSAEDHKAIRAIADAWNLLPTGGSDYHGHDFREGRELGSAPVPQEVAERLFAAREPR